MVLTGRLVLLDNLQKTDNVSWDQVVVFKALTGEKKNEVGYYFTSGSFIKKFKIWVNGAWLNF